MYVTLSSEFVPSTKAPSSSPVRYREAAASPLSRNQAAGTHLFQEGDAATSIYEIVSGVFRLTRVLENGRRQVIAFGFSGDAIGFPKGTCHNSDCKAITAGCVIAHPRKALETADGDHETHTRLLQAALREISAMQDHFMMLARKSAKEKVASFLVTLAERTGTPISGYTSYSLPMNRADIADFLGLTVETVSRTLTCLRNDKMIALEKNRIVLIRDMRALLAASQSCD